MVKQPWKEGSLWQTSASFWPRFYIRIDKRYQYDSFGVTVINTHGVHKQRFSYRELKESYLTPITQIDWSIAVMKGHV